MEENAVIECVTCECKKLTKRFSMDFTKTPNRKVVYTLVFPYEKIHHSITDDNWDYVCFSPVEQTYEGWRTIVLPDDIKNLEHWDQQIWITNNLETLLPEYEVRSYIKNHIPKRHR